MKTSLEQMIAEIPAHYEKKEADPAVAEIKAMRNAVIVKLESHLQEVKTAAAADKADLQTQIDNLQRQADALDSSLADRRHIGGSGTQEKDWSDILKDNESVQRILHDKRGVAVINLKGDECRLIEHKTLIDSTAAGSMTSGVLAIDRTPGIVADARQALRMRNVLSSRPTTAQQVDYIKVNSAPAIASLQLVEGVAKIENSVTFVSASAYVKTIATWFQATRQVLDDFQELGGFLRSTAAYEVALREETSILHGGGGSTDINGLVTQASALQTALALPAYNKSDLISAAMQQVEVASEVPATFVVLHPTDYWQILRTKNTNRDYIFNNKNLDPFWGLTPLRTTKMGVGNFLVGSGSPGAVEIRDRMLTTVTISTEHANFFTENKVAILAESRMALSVYRPGAFVFGSFTTSP